MYYNFNKPLFFFFTVILVLPFASTVSGVGHDDYIVMKKISDGKIVYVFESSVEKLIERNYAYMINDWRNACVSHIVIPLGEKCAYSTNDVCHSVYTLYDSLGLCIEEFDRPTTHEECSLMYKAYLKILSPFPGTSYEGYWKLFCNIK